MTLPSGQRSRLERAQQKPIFNVVGLPKSTIHRDLPNLAAPYRWTFIDGPPRVYDVARSAIMAADIVIIPVQPSPYDVWSAKEIVDLITEATVMKPNLGVWPIGALFEETIITPNKL